MNINGFWVNIAKYGFLTGFVFLSIIANAKIDKSSFYNALASDNENTINAQLAAITEMGWVEKDAFEGALLMKKASFANGASKKLSLFKNGNKKLERAIQANATNAEYRLLRLMIQEHVPKMLKYNTDIKKDSAYIKQNFKTLSPEVQKVLMGYTKQSQVLHPEDFKDETR